MLRDKVFLSTLAKIAIPIIVQQFFRAMLNILDVVMVGQLGDVPVAAVGLANQIFFLLTFVLFGTSSGASVFIAQYWGKGDIANIRKVLGVCLTVSAVGAGLFTVWAVFFPRSALILFTNDPQVISIGADYLRIVGISYVVTSISFSYGAALRSVEDTRLPMIVSVAALVLKTILSYALIFGYLGFPRLGVAGAALGTSIARYLECIALVGAVYAKRSPLAARLKELGGFKVAFLKNYARIALPVMIQETLWSIGMSTYNSVYAHIGTSSAAAVNIASTIEGLAFVLFIGISDSCAVMVGNRIGAGEEKKAVVYARRCLGMSISGALLMGLLIYLTTDWAITFYNVSPETLFFTRSILFVMAFTLWVKVSNMVIIVGVMRSGGDTRYGMFTEMITIWLVGVPLAFLGAFVFNLAVYWVVLLVSMEELAKFIIGMRRIASGKWMNNLVQSPA